MFSLRIKSYTILLLLWGIFSYLFTQHLALSRQFGYVPELSWAIATYFLLALIIGSSFLFFRSKKFRHPNFYLLTASLLVMAGVFTEGKLAAQFALEQASLALWVVGFWRVFLPVYFMCFSMILIIEEWYLFHRSWIRALWIDLIWIIVALALAICFVLYVLPEIYYNLLLIVLSLILMVLSVTRGGVFANRIWLFVFMLSIAIFGLIWYFVRRSEGNLQAFQMQINRPEFSFIKSREATVKRITTKGAILEIIKANIDFPKLLIASVHLEQQDWMSDIMKSEIDYFGPEKNIMLADGPLQSSGNMLRWHIKKSPASYQLLIFDERGRGTQNGMYTLQWFKNLRERMKPLGLSVLMFDGDLSQNINPYAISVIKTLSSFGFFYKLLETQNDDGSLSLCVIMAENEDIFSTRLPAEIHALFIDHDRVPFGKGDILVSGIANDYVYLLPHWKRQWNKGRKK